MTCGKHQFTHYWDDTKDFVVYIDQYDDRVDIVVNKQFVYRAILNTPKDGHNPPREVSLKRFLQKNETNMVEIFGYNRGYTDADHDDNPGHIVYRMTGLDAVRECHMGHWPFPEVLMVHHSYTLIPYAFDVDLVPFHQK